MNNIPVSLYMYVLYRYTATLLTIIYYKYLRWCGGWIWWINAFIYTTETLHCSWIVMSNEQELNLHSPPPPCISQTNYNYIHPNWIEMSYPIWRGFTCRHTSTKQELDLKQMNYGPDLCTSLSRMTNEYPSSLSDREIFIESGDKSIGNPVLKYCYNFLGLVLWALWVLTMGSLIGHQGLTSYLMPNSKRVCCNTSI